MKNLNHVSVVFVFNDWITSFPEICKFSKATGMPPHIIYEHPSKITLGFSL